MTNSQSEQKKQRRRGVLKAVAGAPVIFTLSAGANVAAASISCKDKQTTSPTIIASTSPDTWIRYRVQQQNIKIIKTGESNVTNYNNAFTVDGSTWYLVDNGVVSAVSSIGTFNSTMPTNNNVSYYLLVDHKNYPGSAQSFVFLGSDPSASDAVNGGSCWNSLTATVPGAVQVGSTNVLNPLP